MATDLLPQILPHIQEHIYPQSVLLQDWKLKEGNFPKAASPSTKDTNWWKYFIPAPWGGFDKTMWFRKQIVIPESFNGKPVAVLLDLHEALLYVNGTPFQGIDQHHREALLTMKAHSGHRYQLAIEAYSGRKHEHSSFSSAKLVVVNPTARALSHALTSLHDYERSLQPNSAEGKDLRELIRQTLVFMKYFKPDGEEYPNSIGRAYSFLKQSFEQQYKTDIQGFAHLIAQSHIDVVWLWRLAETKKKCGRTFSTALRLMEEYPDFKYAQSQAVLYEFTKELYPELYKEIKRRVTEGRWFVTGSVWVEPDCNIPNGESLVRQILYGKQFFKREFNIDSDTLWLPDTFGYSWALPQILKKSGINNFFTTKLTWNDTNKFPHNSFWWQGIDGSKVLTHIPPVGLEGSITSKDLKKSWEEFQEKELNPHVMQTFGFGDGGGGVTKEQLDTALIYKSMPGLPQSLQSTIPAFFSQLAAQSDALPIWNNELYLEKHRGTYTTHGWIKRAHRESERLLYTAELFSVLGMHFGTNAVSRRYPQTDLESTWKKLLLNQFHDIVPGTFIADAYSDIQKDFLDIHASCNTIINRCATGFFKAQDKKDESFHFAFFNTLNWLRSEYVIVEMRSEAKVFSIIDHHGKDVQHQILGRKKGIVQLLCYIENMAPYTFLQLTITPLALKPSEIEEWKITERTIETPLYRIRLDSKGQISSLHDIAHRREIVPKGKRANAFQAFRDLPKQWEAWELEPEYHSKGIDLFALQAMKVQEAGPLRAVIQFEHRSESGSKLLQHMMLYHKSLRIDFRTTVFWKEKQTLLKVAFPLNLKSNYATYEIQFGALQRSMKTSDPFAAAKFEVPAQQFADISELKYGVSLLNNCKYGYDAKDRTLRLTLLRSPYYPHPIEPWRLNDTKVTDHGEHLFTYSLLPHSGNWQDGESLHRARELNNPPLLFPGTANVLPSLITLSQNSIIVDSIKKAEDSDSVIIRLHEAHGDATAATLTTALILDKAFECSLLEEDLKELKAAQTKLSLKFSPFEIKTLKLLFRKKK
ncbi:MAG: glycoside hydrolase family 38 C-terminal domain-containing protein [bacterium]